VCLCPESIGKVQYGQSISTKNSHGRSCHRKNTNQFKPRQEGKEVLGAEYPYLSAIGALMYFVNNTRPNIVFAVNCLARHSVAHIMRHWNDIKNILRYLHGTTDLELFYRRNQDSGLIEYVDIVYLSDPLNARS
jgi:hypothetical protein